MKRRGRKFAESDAFFGGLGRGADKFRILPCAKLSAFSRGLAAVSLRSPSLRDLPSESLRDSTAHVVAHPSSDIASQCSLRSGDMQAELRS
jgi:hypothetical protein